MEERLRVDLLGQFRVRHGAAELPELDTPRLRALLGRLALNGGRALDRAALAFELWPDSTEPRARGSLRKLLHSLARRLPDLGAYVEVSDRSLAWRADAPAVVDALEFERLAASRHPADWQSAAQLYAGPLLQTASLRAFDPRYRISAHQKAVCSCRVVPRSATFAPMLTTARPVLTPSSSSTSANEHALASKAS